MKKKQRNSKPWGIFINMKEPRLWDSCLMKDRMKLKEKRIIKGE